MMVTLNSTLWALLALLTGSRTLERSHRQILVELLRGSVSGRDVATRLQRQILGKFVGLRPGVPRPFFFFFFSLYGASRARTGDLLGAIQALSQLSYSPAVGKV